MQQFLICMHSDSTDSFFFPPPKKKKKTGKWLFIGRKNKYKENNTKLGRMGIECKRVIENSEEKSVCEKLS